MIIHAKTKYLDEHADVEFGRYEADGSLSIQLVSGTGEPLCTATSCLSEYGVAAEEDYVWIKTYSENEGILECLIKEGVVHKPVVTTKIGHGEWAGCKLTDASIAEIKREGV